MQTRAFLAAVGSILVLAGPAAAAEKLLVDDDLAQCQAAQFTSVQAAVTAAAALPGKQSIEVCGGTYPENVTIGPGNSVDIYGHGADKTFVTGVAGTPGPIFDAQSSGNVEIEKLTVDGRSLQQGGVVFGIRYAETNGRVKDTAVLNIRNPSGSSQGIAIRVQSSGAPTVVRVEDNLVQNFTRVGVSANGIGVDARVEDNRVVGPVPPKVWAPNGIQISRGAVAVVEGNEVFNATSPNPPAGGGSGILLFCAGATVVEGNRVSDSDSAFALADNANATLRRNEARSSRFEGYSLQYIGTLFGPLGCPLFPSPTEGNLLEGNKSFGSGENGVSIVSFDPTSAPPSNNRIENTDIKDSGLDGIHIFEGAGNYLVDNQIERSGEHDAHDDTAGPGSGGTANFWIDNDCKTPSPRDQNRPGLCRV